MNIKPSPCSHHKCLTSYYQRIFNIVYKARFFLYQNGYWHFKSFNEEFYLNGSECRVVSINNHALDLNKLDNYRLVRFIRDPRDLVVSGYYYHRRGVENWCNIIGPDEKDWETVNSVIPSQIGTDHSFSSFLQTVAKEEGLIAEIDFSQKTL